MNSTTYIPYSVSLSFTQHLTPSFLSSSTPLVYSTSAGGSSRQLSSHPPVLMYSESTHCTPRAQTSPSLPNQRRRTQTFPLLLPLIKSSSTPDESACKSRGSRASLDSIPEFMMDEEERLAGKGSAVPQDQTSSPLAFEDEVEEDQHSFLVPISNRRRLLMSKSTTQ